VTEIEERPVGDLAVRIDRSRCVGFGHCIEEAPEAFALGEDDLVEFQNPDQVQREALLTACEVCPVEALTVFDKTGKQLVP
jgi:ferredoxin